MVYFPGSVWRVTDRSGMGARHSSALCDAAFSGVAELGFTNAENTMRKFMIKSYYRFRDDIFLHVGSVDIFCTASLNSGQGAYTAWSLSAWGSRGTCLLLLSRCSLQENITGPRPQFHGPIFVREECTSDEHPVLAESPFWFPL